MELTHVDMVEPQSPPSTYAVASFMDGVPGTWYRVVEVTAVRAFFLGTGLYLMGFRVDATIHPLSGCSSWLMLC